MEPTEQEHAVPILHADPTAGRTSDIWFLRFDARGRERPDADGARRDRARRSRARRDRARNGSGAHPRGPRLLSVAIADRLRAGTGAGPDGTPGEPYTDVVVMTHGWLSTEAGAEDTFAAWTLFAERERAAWQPRDRPFRPLVIGLYWPSAPPRLGARAARAASRHVPFEPKTPKTPASATTADAGDRGRAERPNLLDVVSLLLPWASFYRMKDRAQTIGRRGLAPFLDDLRHAAGGAAVHLVGHSLGGKLVAEALAHPTTPDPPHVETLFLLQGAFSAWGFADRNDYDGARGSVRRIVDDGLVRGTIVATTSRGDHALHRMFPGAEYIDLLVTTAKRFRIPLRLHEPGGPPRLAALGAWGFAGLGDRVRTAVLHADERDVPATPLGLDAGSLWHLDCDAVITAGLGPDPSDPDGPERRYDEPLVGGHSNLLHPELAAAFWQAAFATRVTEATA